MAPYLSGTFSLQSLPMLEGEPEITAYRQTEEATTKWLDVVGNLGDFRGHLLRSGPSCWDVFDAGGKHIGKRSDPGGAVVLEVEESVSVDRTAFEASVRNSLFNDDLILVATAEFHGGASAAEHSNFGVLCRRMIVEASPADLVHMYVADDHTSACRVIGLFVDLGRLSGDMADAYFDRRGWLVEGRPLVDNHHTSVLAGRLSNARKAYATQVLDTILELNRIPADISLAMRTRWLMASGSLSYRVCQTLVSILYPSLCYHGTDAETFDPEAIKEHGRVLMSQLRVILR